MQFKTKLYGIIFGTKTKAGRLFDVVLLWLITASVFVVIIESLPEIKYNKEYSRYFLWIEMSFTIIFTIEYILRIWASPRPFRYIFSYWGLVDFIAIFPTYFLLLNPGSHSLMIIRVLRLFRIFRVLKLKRYILATERLNRALKESFYRISTFLFLILIIVCIMGAVMYIVEGSESGFTSIPQGIYWAIITITTVGYGDLVPITVVGKIMSSVVMIIGYSIIAVPMGIFTAEILKSGTARKVCSNCGSKNDREAKFCDSCGSKFEPDAKIEVKIK